MRVSEGTAAPRSRLLTPDCEGRIRALVAANDRMGAIKLYRTETGRDLRAAVDAVKAIAGDAWPSPPTPVERRALEWALCGQTGISSEAIARHMVGLPLRAARNDWPSDPSDLGRCIRLLDLIPEWRPRLGEMAEHGEVWARLVAAWDEIEALYREELPTRYAPRCLRRMRELIDGEARDNA